MVHHQEAAMALDDAQEAALRGELSNANGELGTLREALKKANKEAQGHRLNADRANEAAEAATTALEVAKTEAKAQAEALRTELIGKADAAEARAAEAKVNADQRTIQAEVRAAAVMAGMKKPDLVKLLDLSAVKLDETGKVVIPEALFEDAKKSDPYLFGTAVPHTSNPSPQPRPEPAGVKKAAEMTPEQRAEEGRKLGITALR